MHRAEYERTGTGIIIGCAYIPKPRQPGKCEEQIQRIMLQPRRESIFQRLLKVKK